MVKHSMNYKQACDMCDEIVVDLVLMVKIPLRKLDVLSNLDVKTKWNKPVRKNLHLSQ